MKKATTPKAKIKRIVFDRSIYNTLAEAQQGIREHGTDDYISIYSLLYTMEEFDHDGKYITYYNKRSDTRINVETSNRYGSTGFTDAIVTIDENTGYYRTGINYLD